MTSRIFTWPSKFMSAFESKLPVSSESKELNDVFSKSSNFQIHPSKKLHNVRYVDAIKETLYEAGEVDSPDLKEVSRNSYMPSKLPVVFSEIISPARISYLYDDSKEPAICTSMISVPKNINISHAVTDSALIYATPFLVFTLLSV